MSVGVWQLLLILVIIFVVFGPGKLPTVINDLGEGIKNFRKGLNGGGTMPSEPIVMKDVTPKADSNHG